MSDDGLVLEQIGLVGEEGGRVVVLAKCLKGWDGRLDHGNVIGLEDLLEDVEDAQRKEGEVFGCLFDQGGDDLEGDLYISAKKEAVSWGPEPLPSRGRGCLPYPLAIDITRRLLFQEAADLLDLGTARLDVEEQVAQLARVRLDVDGALGGSGVAFQDEDLMLRPTSLL